MLAAGAREAVVGDMRLAADMQAAAAGVRAIYHICPNMHPDEVEMGHVAVQAGRTAGVSRFVYHSVLHPQTEAMPHHWQKLRVEELLLTAGLPFTILQPAVYMQNILGSWAQIIRQGIYEVPYPVGTRLSMVDLRDVAEAAADVLSKDGHKNATYELVGTMPLPQTAVAVTLGQQLNRPVKAREIALADWQQQAEATGLDGYSRDALIKMFRYYAQFGLAGNPRILTQLLGRRPTSLMEFIAAAITGEE